MSRPSSGGTATDTDYDCGGGDGEGVRVMSLLPLGLDPVAHEQCSLDGWAVEAGRHRNGEGRVRSVYDFECGAATAELSSTLRFRKVAVTCPADEGAIIGCALPVLVLHVKNVGSFFGAEVTLEDAGGTRRTVSASNAQSVVRASKSSASLPMHLSDGWNRVELDLADLCGRLFQAQYGHTERVRIFGNTRVLKAFFTTASLPRAELPGVLRAPTVKGERPAA